VKDLWQPKDKQEEIQEAAKKDDPLKRRLQRISLTEHHPDRIALGDIDALRLSRRMGDV